MRWHESNALVPDGAVVHKLVAFRGGGRGVHPQITCCSINKWQMSGFSYNHSTLYLTPWEMLGIATSATAPICITAFSGHIRPYPTFLPLCRHV